MTLKLLFYFYSVELIGVTKYYYCCAPPDNNKRTSALVYDVSLIAKQSISHQFLLCYVDALKCERYSCIVCYNL